MAPAGLRARPRVGTAKIRWVTTYDDAAGLLLLDDDEVLALLDQELFGTSSQISPSEVQVAVRRARRALDLWVEANREKFCKDVTVHGLLSEDGRDRSADLAVVLDFILAQNGNMPVATLSALLIKYGVGRICLK